MYTDSEEKLGEALKGKRNKVIIASKSAASTKEQFLADLEDSLKLLQTDYIDLMQLHNPKFLPNPDDPDSAIAALDYAQKQGLIRFKGLQIIVVMLQDQELNMVFLILYSFPFL